MPSKIATVEPTEFAFTENAPKNQEAKWTQIACLRIEIKIEENAARNGDVIRTYREAGGQTSGIHNEFRWIWGDNGFLVR